MFSIMSATDLKAVNWAYVEGIQVAQTDGKNDKSGDKEKEKNEDKEKRGEKRRFDESQEAISSDTSNANIENQCAAGILLFNNTVSSLNPDHHAIYLNTFPRFRDFDMLKEEKEKEKEKDKDKEKEKEKEKDQLKQTEKQLIEKPEPLTATQFYEKFVKRSQDECDAEREAKQGTKEWLEVRKLSLTASVFGAAAGSNPYQSPNDLLEEKLWGTFNGNALTVWGNEHEPHARESFVKWFKEFLSARYFFAGRSDSDNPIFELKEDNAIKFAAEPWLAVSPDGILYYEDADGSKKVSLVEFKCPTRDNFNPLQSPYAKYEHGIPSYYKDQVQGICGYLNENKYALIEDIWFVVWRPSRTWITHLQADKAYYQNFLKPKLFAWYFKLYLPALTKKYNAGGERSLIESLQL